MKKILVVGLAAAAATVVVIGAVRLLRPSKKAEGAVVLYGNVDLRQVDLSFNGSDRIAAVLVEEGERVKKGQVLARLDTSRLEPEAAQAQAAVAAQGAAVDRLHNGSRPEEIVQAEANVSLAQADLFNVNRQWRRVSLLAARTTGLAVSKQDVDGAQAALAVAQARLTVAAMARDLAVAGPRREDVAQAEAQLHGLQSNLQLLLQQLGDAQLKAPCDAVVRSRLLEAGEMASPQRPVYSLAITDPKWIRVYASEPDLGRIHPGAAATVASDSFPDRRFTGSVGFISPVAEFTPKEVQTEELRSNLVYEVRIIVKDPGDELRLGMPATVRIEPSRPQP